MNLSLISEIIQSNLNLIIMKTIIQKIIVVAIIFPLFAGCATVFSGSSQTVTFQSEPPGADVVAVKKNGTEITVGTTPCTVDISKKTKEIKFVKENYYDEKYAIYANLKLNGWYFVDLFGCLVLVGVPSAIVDMSTKSYYKLPESVNVELKKKP